MNTSLIQQARAEHAIYSPDPQGAALDSALGMRRPPFSAGTKVRIGKHQRDGGDIPFHYPRLDSNRCYVHTPSFGWQVVAIKDLQPI